MKGRYDGSPGKEAVMANVRQTRFEAERNSDCEFAKRQNEEMARKGGKSPNLKEESMQFNAYMCNNGEHAQELARTITAGLDKTAFPVK